MPAPLIDPALADREQTPALVAVLHDEGVARETGMHQHARGQLLGAHRGLLTVIAAQGRWVVPAVHAVWLPPACPHGLRSHGPYVGWNLYVAPSRCADLPTQPCTLQTTALLRAAVERAATWSGLARDAAQRSLEEVLLAETRALAPQSLGLPMPQDPRLRQAAQAALEAPAEAGAAMDGKTSARRVGLSLRSFQRRFAAETGMGWQAWLRQARLLRAMEELAVGRSVTAVALDAGYGNVGAFIEMFRRQRGCTPGAYQRSAAERERAPRN